MIFVVLCFMILSTTSRVMKWRFEEVSKPIIQWLLDTMKSVYSHFSYRHSKKSCSVKIPMHEIIILIDTIKLLEMKDRIKKNISGELENYSRQNCVAETLSKE